MSETKRYRLPEQLGGGEVEIESVWFDMTATVTLMADTSMQFRLARQWLKEIPPPIPTEPEPGAYLIGGVLAVCVERGEWRVPSRETPGPDGWSVYRFLWPTVWEKLGGPDVDIVPLVAANPLADAVVTAAKAWREALVLTGMNGLTPKAAALADAVFALSAADRAEAGE